MNTFTPHYLLHYYRLPEGVTRHPNNARSDAYEPTWFRGDSGNEIYIYITKYNIITCICKLLCSQAAKKEWILEYQLHSIGWCETSFALVQVLQSPTYVQRYYNQICYLQEYLKYLKLYTFFALYFSLLVIN